MMKTTLTTETDSKEYRDNELERKGAIVGSILGGISGGSLGMRI